MDRPIAIERKRRSITEMALLAAVAFALTCPIALTVFFFVDNRNGFPVRTVAAAVFFAAGLAFFGGMALRAVYGRRFGIFAQVAAVPLAALWGLLFWATTVHWSF